jgi:5-carboxymethyl-2-hydroxymuconate isomerase
MPHLVVEYSQKSLNKEAIRHLMAELAAAAARTGVMKAYDIKVRAQGYSDFLVAGKEDTFVHVSVYLLAGRTPEQKVDLSEQLRQVLIDACPEVVSLSVDIRDMDPVAYKKRLM